MYTNIEAFEDQSSESGMATAEYAVGTMAASSFAGIILWLVQQPWVKEAIESIFKNIFKM
ncbi:DUF4244 domain-containing protein [Ancrocorticia populi]|uniref:DUF4244 domain-containing protein n=1 Tax=Ancrocorticia populi TaxID=2175228 RepID=A0A2V1KEQ1_9ACTO|nr:DUF4244 domain-containing protein [Ancrocorticia populi]PWF27749.1 DUF4244 domain-containing protein [Ancrocorticia populi]